MPKDIIRKVCWNYETGNPDVPVSVVIPLHYARANQKIAEELGVNNGAKIVYGFYHSLDSSNGYSFFSLKRLKRVLYSDTIGDDKEQALLIKACESFFEEQQKQLNRQKRKIRVLEKQLSVWDDT